MTCPVNPNGHLYLPQLFGNNTICNYCHDTVGGDDGQEGNDE